jgi:hypothetical protein
MLNTVASNAGKAMRERQPFAGIREIPVGTLALTEWP